MSSRVARALDPILGSVGVAFGLGSLTYPFGRDQGLYYYVAREWVVRGAIPYRDVLDHKTPGIYLLHALAIRLFGETMWGIRVLDLLAVVAVGLTAASLTAAAGERIRPGLRGFAVFATSVLFYGYLNFWNTAQSELWYSLLGVASVACVIRIEKVARAALIAGLLAGAALLVKPPAMWIIVVAVMCLVRRVRLGSGTFFERVRPALGPLVRFGAGGAVIPALVLGYFGVKGALPAMFDIVVGANSYYVKHEGGASAIAGIGGWHWCYSPLVPALMTVGIWSAWRRRGSRYVLAMAITCAAYLAVLMQGKFYLLHWTVVVPAFVLIATNAARDLEQKLQERAGAGTGLLAAAIALLVLYSGALMTWRGPAMWYSSTQHAYRWWRAKETRDQFTWNFAEPTIAFFFWTSERVGNWLREHTTPDDFVAVRGFQPEIYAVAHRKHAGRFFWTTFLTNPARAYRREEWLKEDLDALKAAPPKYVVVLTGYAHGPDSVEYFEPLGYRTVEVMWEFTIMERVAPSP
jgi:hypothetical protein